MLTIFVKCSILDVRLGSDYVSDIASGTVVQWLSLLFRFIQLNLNSGSSQVQVLLAVCRRFMMVRISDSGPGWKKGLMPFIGQPFTNWSSVNHSEACLGPYQKAMMEIFRKSSIIDAREINKYAFRIMLQTNCFNLPFPSGPFLVNMYTISKF